MFFSFVVGFNFFLNLKVGYIRVQVSCLIKQCTQVFSSDLCDI